MKRSSWIDKFLTSDTMTKLAKQVESNYIKQLQKLKDEVTATTKWSSIEEALEDFATRNGLSRKEIKSLQKAAGLIPATEETPADKLMEEGIGSQGAEFMAKSKKHSHPGRGPFVVTNPSTADQIRERSKSLHDAVNSDKPQSNEMQAIDQAAYWNIRFQKYAQEFGKILDMPGVGTEEGIKKLVEELAPTDYKSTYNLVRHGFKFTNVHGEGFAKKDEPVKVTVYQYSFLKTNIAHAINQTLRQQLAQELPIDEWIAFLESKGGSQARDIKMQLQKLQRDLFSDKPGFVETELDRAKPQSINGILQFFPRSYQRVILSMLAEGEYRHLTGGEGRKHSQIFSSGYALGSFILMESFDPYVKIVPQLKTKEDKQALVSALTAASPKDVYENEEFISLLDSLGISHQDMPVTKEYQTLKMADKSIRINNNTNPSYRPVTNKLSPQELTDPEAVEEQLKSFQDRLASIIMQDSDRIEKAKAEGRPAPSLTPLAYEKQADGTYVPVDLKTLGTRDLTKTKLTYQDPTSGEKVHLDNPTAGIHPSYKGSFEGLQTQEPFFSGSNVGRWKSQPQSTTPPPTATPPTTSEPTPEQKKQKEDRWERFKNKAKDLKKFQASTRIMIRLGAADLWIDDKGRIYPSQDQMEKTLYEECVSEAETNIIDKVADDLSIFVQQMPSDNVVPFKPKESPTPEEEQEEKDRLPLAARSIERLKKIAHKSKRLQQLLKE